MSTLLSTRRRAITLLAGLAASAVLLAPSAAGAETSTTVHLNGVRTTLTTDPATTKAMVSHGIVPLPVKPASVGVSWGRSGVSLRYAFPITGGRVDAASLAGYINHSGGLRFVNLGNGHRLTLTNFRILISAHPGLTAEVNGDPGTRVRILNLDLSGATIERNLPMVDVAGVKATLTKTAAGALNSALGVRLFTAGITLGTANVDARVG